VQYSNRTISTDLSFNNTNVTPPIEQVSYGFYLTMVQFSLIISSRIATKFGANSQKISCGDISQAPYITFLFIISLHAHVRPDHFFWPCYSFAYRGVLCWHEMLPGMNQLSVLVTSSSHQAVLASPDGPLSR